ncbi:MAG: 3-hydroxyacyl-ACP dehydratase FabZ [Gammaproteobacteria bacterium]|nr:3-hydroxyacyl-ACP dehydratase FabZ [Gammaproteobacteria bacterium]MCH9744047.1 3-hydroxyacyl-ACP dehydratase FabZ [Gammaproteobacteria bacterium]
MIDLTKIDIKNYLPHRYPFLLVDRVLSLEEDVAIKAIKNVSHNEPFFNGHFPAMPVMPGVLMIEALAQASGLLIFLDEKREYNPKVLYFLAGINNARFKRTVQPGDQLELNVQLVKQRANYWRFEGQAVVDGEVACSAEFMSMRGETVD